MRVLISGTSRGIGLEFTRQFLAAGDEVYALARAPERSDGLLALGEAHPGTLHVGRVDVSDRRLIGAAHEAVRKVWDGVDLLINNAGTYGSRDSKLDTLDLDEVRAVMETNAMGPLNMVHGFLDLLRRGQNPRLVNMTSLMGSIKDNTSGGAWSYRISKAALNMVSRNLSHELSPLGVVTIVMHPGWVQTDMGGSTAPLPLQEAASSMVRTIRRLGAEHNGAFLDRDGNQLPW
ncbi:MAG: SDR family oxidoreductase [Acidobacteriota bacterium]|nr:SDR family oxidoreductase [Acidobacteriota bacterium]